jgi:LacI family transcriptional regulator
MAGVGGGDKGAIDGVAARPTLKTIAYMTGLAVTTVSRALKDAPDIGQATKERVRLVARQIGYRPNRAGVRLRTGKTNVISLILSVEADVLGLTSHLVYGISEYLAGSPYHLIVTPYDLRRDPLDPVRYIVETGSADGLIFSRTEPKDARVRYLHERGFPFATHGRTDMGIEHAFFDFDNERYAEIAVERLAARGRRRLALVPPPAHLTYCRHMTAGFEAAAGRLGLGASPLGAITTDHAHDDIEATVRRMMERPDRADGLVCASSAAGIAAICGAEAAGLRIGVDFDVAVKESFNLMKKFRPQVEVVKENFPAAGRNLAAAILRTIEGCPAAELQTISKPDRDCDDAKAER